MDASAWHALQLQRMDLEKEVLALDGKLKVQQVRGGRRWHPSTGVVCAHTCHDCLTGTPLYRLQRQGSVRNLLACGA